MLLCSKNTKCAFTNQFYFTSEQSVHGGEVAETINIERTLISTILEFQFNGTDHDVLKIELDPEVFLDPFHKFIVQEVNKLRDQEKPTDTDFLRMSLINKGIWNLNWDDMLIEIQTANTLGTVGSFNDYYNELKSINRIKKTIKVQL